ncbi:MAG TPA: type II toxin-antitoxin system HicA family toxin [Desulfobacterales bacterium]|nr:type II toxin-antitoxin system HicA family toxin [Desulfobacterales bacterium]
MPKGTLKLRELLNRLKPYGVVVIPGRGRGSELILLRPVPPGAKTGPQYPIKNHGMGTEIAKPVISALLRRFKITNFWD